MRNSLIAITAFLMIACGSGRKAITGKKSKPVNVGTQKEVKMAPTKHVVKEVANVVKNTKKNAKSQLNATTLAYVQKFAPLAMDEMRKFNVPASITLAQGILESGSGKSKLASKSNNHFGIKCHKGWKGAKVYHDDDAKGECFRKYKYAATSYQDHSLFLSTRFRYASLFSLKKEDYKGWAKGLRKAGYATDPKYPSKLISFIEKYNLDKYDDLVLHGKVVASDFKYAVSEKEIKALNTKVKVSKKSKKGEIHSVNKIENKPRLVDRRITHITDEAQKTNNKRVHIVTEDDTLYSISKKYGISVADIRNRNVLPGNTIKKGDQLILSEEVKAATKYHIVQKKETLYSISRKYKLTVVYLKKINNLQSNSLSIGQKLILD